MEHIIFSANVVLPLMLLMATGYFCRYIKLVDGKSTTQYNGVVFWVFLPALLFNNVRNSSLDSIANPDLFVFSFVFVLATFGTASLIMPHIERDRAKCGVMIQGVSRSNYSIFGIPMLMLLMPDADVGIAALLAALVIPMFNVLSVAILTTYGSGKSDAKSIAIGIMKNPLIISTFAGLLFLVCDLKLPKILDTTMMNLGNIATPLALFLLGAGFEFSSLKRILKQTIITVTGRLVVVPTVVLTIAVLCGFRDVELACLLIVFGSPTAVASYAMAQKMKGDAQLASAIVLFTSLFSIVSLFFIILVLKSLALI